MSWMKKMALGLALGASLTTPAWALDQIVQKRTFRLPVYTTVGGQTVKEMKVGFETYGTLNDSRDNAILITHFYSGTSHAAGKYAESDAAPGYWDTIIGPGKPLDTDKYFIIASDTPLNLNTKDPHVVTTGPASINPDTGKPWGMDFPVLSIGDFVRVQKSLVDSFGIPKLRAVAGASMGSMQALEWSAAYPEMVDKVVAVIPPGLEFDAYQIGVLSLWAAPIKLDPRWQGGAYAEDKPPVDGLALALANVTLDAVHNGWANAKFGRAMAEPGKDPAQSLDNDYAVASGLAKMGSARAAKADARHFVYLARANQQFTIADRLDRLRARYLLMPASSDLLFPPALSHAAAATLKQKGRDVQVVEIPGTGGHLDGVTRMAEVAEPLRSFLAQ